MRHCFYVIALMSLTLVLENQGCHNAMSGEDEEDEEHSRKRRQAPTSMSQVEQKVETTRLLRNYFVDCLRDKAGDVMNFDGVVDFTILDTRWFDVSDNVTCRNDTVPCWEERLEVYLRPNSNLLEISKACIEQLDVDVNATRRLVYRGRSKRSRPGHKWRPHRPNPSELLKDMYASCVQQEVRLPQNRRPINLNSVVEFVEDHVFCGECGVPGSLSDRRHKPYWSSWVNERSSTDRRSGDWRLPTTRSGRKRRSTSSLSSTASPTRLRKESTSVTVYPFIFEGVTEGSSPLINPISDCNKMFMDLFVPNPCSNLRNVYSNSFCTQQQKQCENLRGVMETNCARTCCERNREARLPVGWTEWTQWGECAAPCGQRVAQVRRRMCPLGVPSITPCDGEASETRICERDGCPSWGQWSSWSPCQVTCGRHHQLSTRRCVNGVPGAPGCLGTSNRMRTCNRGECFGIFQQWTQWTSCTASCSGGSQVRSRSCVGRHRCRPDKSGTKLGESRWCMTNQCPGRWGKWGSYSPCQVSCGGRDTYYRRTRRCIEGQVGQSGCLGPEIERKECGRTDCPKPVWGKWSEWSDCAWKRRVRTCLNGSPGDCSGENTDFSPCRGCRKSDSVSAYWGTWGAWSKCGGNCRRVKRRRRGCRGGRTGQAGCRGIAIQRQICRTYPGCYPQK